MHRIGKSACDQCSYCTEFCPRYLLGYEVVPHKVMRSLGFTLAGSDLWNQSAELCCACGLCTLYACPEDLYPKEACDRSKRDMRAAGIKFVQQKPVVVHPMKESRRVPLAQLRRRLKIEAYEGETPYQADRPPAAPGPHQALPARGQARHRGRQGRATGWSAARPWAGCWRPTWAPMSTPASRER